MKSYSIKMAAVNKLKGLRAYLCGCMDRVPDGGVGWRRKIVKYLDTRGVIVFDPSNKHIDIGVEDLENRSARDQWKKEGKYDLVAEAMKVIRSTDLRMVDLSDFLIVNIDSSRHACGTYEELFLANRQKKPIIVRVEQGKEHTPDWLMGAIPHEMIFSTWGEIKDYLDQVNAGITTNHRWVFFDI